MNPPIKPYTFADFIAMKPGTLVGGFMHLQDSWHLGPEWFFQEDDVYPLQRTTFNFQPILESKVQWRRIPGTKFSGSKIHRESIASWDLKGCSTKVAFDIAQPIGMYLGHIMRSNSVTYVNILSPDGQDIWI